MCYIHFEHIPYKYRLRVLFIEKFGAAWRTARENFCKQEGIPPSTMRYDFNLKATDPQQIDATRLEKYSALLGLQPTDLRTKLSAAA